MKHHKSNHSAVFHKARYTFSRDIGSIADLKIGGLLRYTDQIIGKCYFFEEMSIISSCNFSSDVTMPINLTMNPDYTYMIILDFKFIQFDDSVLDFNLEFFYEPFDFSQMP
jgi:hypothetical protein